MSELVIAGRIVSMAARRDREPGRGRVWIRDGEIVEVTTGTKTGGRVQQGARGRCR